MDAQTIINNGESQWVYLSDMNEVQIMEHDPEEEMTPNKLFTIYENGYKYTYIGASSVQGKRLQLIDLFPEESGDFMKINIAIDAVKNEIYRIRMHDKNGGTYTYLVNSFKSNTKTKPFYFDNEKHQGVEVIDLR
jgi:outer membrane lipoprotein carrier protein